MNHWSGSPLGVCVAGIGGFAAAHHHAIQNLERAGEVRLLAACDPRHRQLEAERETFQFEERGVSISGDFEGMLRRHSGMCELVTIATPIDLHAAMHEACVKRNLACYLEKPPTLDPGELDQMIQHDRLSKYQTQVGFSFIVEAWRRQLKERIVQGEFGRVRYLSLLGCWQRSEAYFNRTRWAGKLFSESGQLLLDSCFGNAMAHYVHNILFFAGEKSVLSWPEITTVRTELYRANDIEAPDTVFSEARMTNGADLRVAVTHACRASRQIEETIICERATVRIFPGHRMEIFHHAGGREELDLRVGPNLLFENLRHYGAYLRGELARPLTSLEDSRPFVEWNALNYVSAGGIHHVPASKRTKLRLPDGGAVWVVNDIESHAERFVRDGEFLSEIRGFQASSSVPVGRTALCRLREAVSEFSEKSMLSSV